MPQAQTALTLPKLKRNQVNVTLIRISAFNMCKGPSCFALTYLRVRQIPWNFFLCRDIAAAVKRWQELKVDFIKLNCPLRIRLGKTALWKCDRLWFPFLCKAELYGQREHLPWTVSCKENFSKNSGYGYLLKYSLMVPQLISHRISRLWWLFLQMLL